MAKQFSPEVIWLPIEKITPYPLNNKLHPPSQIDAIAGSILEYGFDVPIVVDEDGVILKGHGRHLAARKLNLTQVPVIVRSDLTAAQKKACRIADNKVGVSDWDYESLKVELEELKELDFDLDLTGFSIEECDSLFNLGVMDFQGKQIFGEDGAAPEPGRPLGYLQSSALNPNPQPTNSPDHQESSPDNDQKSDGSLQALIEVTIAPPRHQVEKGQVWRLGSHLLVVAEVVTGWQQWVKWLDGDVLFAPYPGPFVPLTLKAEERSLVMVQPDEYIAGHILDQYENVKGVGSVSKN
jgi:ParB-like nuclease domain